MPTPQQEERFDANSPKRFPMLPFRFSNPIIDTRSNEFFWKLVGWSLVLVVVLYVLASTLGCQVTMTARECKDMCGNRGVIFYDPYATVDCVCATPCPHDSVTP